METGNSVTCTHTSSAKIALYIGIMATIFLGSTLAYPFFIFAQEATTSTPDFSKSSVQLVADVNLQDCIYTQASSTDQLITIICNITNKLGNQGDIRYGVQLIKKGSYDPADSKVYDQVLSLGLNQTISQKMEYTPPSYLNGKFDLVGILKTSDGLPLSKNILGTVILKSTTPVSLEIQNDTCYLYVTGETTSYTVQQGVDIDANETLEGKCVVDSLSANEITVTPSFVTHRRSIFGEVVQDSKDVQKSISFKKGEEKIMTFTLPKASEPQAYDTVLTLVTADGTVASTPLTIHYVLRGASATVQNVLLDKNEYAKGDTAKVSVLWTGSADTFPGSRKQETDAKVSSVVISLKDGKGEACSKESIFTISTNSTEGTSMLKEYLIPILQTCINPQVLTKIVDATGITLAEKSISIVSTPAVEISFWQKWQNILRYGLIILLSIVVLGTILFVIKRKK